MNALPIAVSPLATPASAPSGVPLVGAAGPTGAKPADGGAAQNFAAALGASAAPPAPPASKLPAAPAAAGGAAKTAKSKSAPVVAGSDATVAGTPLPLPGNPPPSDVAVVPGSGDSGSRGGGSGGSSSGSGGGSGGSGGGSGGSGGGGSPSIAGAGAAVSTSGTVVSSALITAADVSAAATGEADPGSAGDPKSAFSRMLSDGIENLPPGLSAEAPRIAGGAPTSTSAEATGAADRGRTFADPTAATGASAGAAAGTGAGTGADPTASATADAAALAANPGAETDAIALARERGGSGSTAAAPAVTGMRAGAADAAADTSVGGGSGQASDVTSVVSAAASDAMTSSGAQARTAISAIAAAAGGNDKHAQDSAGGTAAVTAAAAAVDGAGSSALLGSASPAADAGGAAQAKIDAPLTSPEFTQAIAGRVSYLVDNNLNGATLQVTPPQLGPIELRVTLEAGHAQVSMSAHNPATLDALQAGAPKLRELLAAQGFGQVSVDVSQRSFQDGSPYAQSRPWTPSAESDDAAAPADLPVAGARAPVGVLDAYA